MRSILVAACVVAFAVLIPVTTMAASPATHPTPPVQNGGGGQHTPDGQAPNGPGGKPSPGERSLEQLKAEGDRLVTERLRLIDRLISQVQASKYLNSDDISALVSGLQSDKDQLKALQQKLDGETTVDAAQADVKKIQEFSVGAAVVIARGEIVRASDLILKLCESGGWLANLQTQLQAAITAAPSSVNTTDLNSKLSDLQAQVKTACTDAQKAHDDALKATTLADLKAARPELVSARQALVRAEVDAKQILAALKAGSSPSPEASESPEPSDSPEASESPKVKVTPTATPTPTPTPTATP